MSISSAARKKRLEDKKRRHPIDHASSDKAKKKPKIYSPLTEGDKSVLDHWNKIQLAAINNPSRRLISKGDTEEFNQQDLLIRQQNHQLEIQQRQMMEQQRRIQQQSDQIRILVHQQKILIRECKAAGIKIPLTTPNPSPNITYPQLTPSAATVTANTKVIQTKVEPSLTSSSCKLTSPVHPLLMAPPPHQLVYQHPPSSHYDPPPTPPLPTLSKLPPLQSVTYSIAPPPPPPPYPDSYPIPHHIHDKSPEFVTPYPGQGVLPMTPSEHTLSYFGPSAEFFSPLTSKELVELTSQEVRKLSPFALQSIDSFVPPLQDDMDKFFNLPNGCGSGYGLGISDDELHVTIPDHVEV